MIRALAALLLLLNAALADAHTGGITGFATVSVSDRQVRYALTLSNPATGPMAQSLRPGTDGRTDYRPLLAAMRTHLHVTNAGVACAPGEGRLDPPAAGAPGIVATVDFACEAAVSRLAIRDDLSEALGADHHTLALVLWNGGSQQFAFGQDARSAEFDIQGAALASRGAGSFFPLGIEHILSGYDHLLFLLVLILRGGNLVQLLKTITGFTVAHSVTLALAALDVVTLPGALVEAVIALSIAYVAAENLFPKYAISRRWAVSFAFGLVHGFGFSSVLKEVGLPKENLLLSLLNFNLGVEAGQAVVVLMVVPVLIRLRRTDWEPRAVTAISWAVLAFGLLLFAQRVLFGPG